MIREYREPRPPIGRAIKRSVRQRCGFGCVICGIPLYQYDHMIEWSVVKEHREENLTLLCNKHHQEKTDGLLPYDDVVRANKNPYNIINGETSPYKLHFSGDKFDLWMGGNSLTSNNFSSGKEVHALKIDDKSIISFKNIDDKLNIGMNIYDIYNERILNIEENELVMQTKNWDVEFVGKTLTLRERERQVTLSIEFLPPNQIKVLSANIFCNGIYLKSAEDSLQLVNNDSSISGMKMVGGDNVIYIGENFPAGQSSAVYFGGVCRYPRGGKY